jgi:hypothetical protein
MRVMAVLMGPINGTVARQIRAGVIMDTHDMSFDSSVALPGGAPVPATRLADAIRRKYVDSLLRSPVGSGAHTP